MTYTAHMVLYLCYIKKPPVDAVAYKEQSIQFNWIVLCGQTNCANLNLRFYQLYFCECVSFLNYYSQKEINFMMYAYISIC